VEKLNGTATLTHLTDVRILTIISRRRCAKVTNLRGMSHGNLIILKRSTIPTSHLPLATTTTQSEAKRSKEARKKPRIGNEEITMKQTTTPQTGRQCTEASQRNGMYGASNDRDNGELYSVAGVIVLFVCIA
jgi:hypothetical protein